MAARATHSGQGSEHTGAHLALALLGYFVLVTLVITLSPFDFAFRRFRISFAMVPSDIVANVALFLPLGFLGRSFEGASARLRGRALWVAIGFSVLVETAQIFIRGRYVSPIDVASNACGAYLGVLLRDRLERMAVWNPNLVGRIGLDVPLVGLLYLLVPQLWLSSVGLVEDARRSVTTLLLGCAGSIVLVALHRHRWPSGARLAARVVPPLALVWFMVGALPAATAAPRTFGAMAVSLAVLTWWFLRRDPVADEQRFEVATLQRFLPVFALYLVVAALWPPFRPMAPWHGAVGFADRLNNASVVDLLLLLEQVGGFTLLGYAAAEWRGRRELSLAADLPRVALAATAFATSLELAQGLLFGPGASAMRALLSTSGALYGVAVYHLARAHVRALRVPAAAGSKRITEAA
jgi:glycopeptide antibiotics resistance protein